MGTTVFFGGDKSGNSLSQTYNRYGTDVVTHLMDHSIYNNHELYEKIMEQASSSHLIFFDELSEDEFNYVIKEVRLYIANFYPSNDWEKFIMQSWKDELEPIFEKEVRYDEKKSSIDNS